MWLVYGHQGDYSDWVGWCVRVCESEAAAIALAANLQADAERWMERRQRDPRMPWPTPSAGAGPLEHDPSWFPRPGDLPTYEVVGVATLEEAPIFGGWIGSRGPDDPPGHTDAVSRR